MDYSYISKFSGKDFYYYLQNNKEILKSVIDLLINSFSSDLDNFKIAIKDRPQWMLKFLQQTFSNYIFVYHKNKEIIGIVICELLDYICYIESFCVSKKYRRQHIGTSLLLSVIRDMVIIVQFKLEVLVENAGAISFYKKNNFVILSTEVDKKDGSKFYIMSYDPAKHKLNRLPPKVKSSPKVKRSTKKRIKYRLHSF